MKRLTIIALIFVLAGLGCRKPAAEAPVGTDGTTLVARKIQIREEPLATFFPVARGERIKSGPLTIEIKDIAALTARGCEGGPTGCPDSVEMMVSFSRDSQTFRLVVLGGSKGTASSERTVFGHRVVLSSVERDRATLGVFVARNPTAAPTPSGF